MSSLLKFLVSLCVLYSLEVGAQSSSSYSDGPYLFYNETNNHIVVQQLCDNKTLKNQYQLTEMDHLLYSDCFNAKQKITGIKTSFQEDDLIYQGEFDVVAVSDFHGQYDLVIELLSRHNIINKNQEWQFGNGHLVITGDVFDRGDKVIEIFWFLYQLEQQAKNAGGKVHFLIGNHEAMVLNNDLRYLHEKYIETAKHFNMTYPEIFSNNSILGRWLRSKNVVVKINGNLYLHGGISHALVEKKMHLNDINLLFKRSLVMSDMERQRTHEEQFLHDKNGPVWYRGYFYWPIIPISMLEEVLAYYDASKVVVGHTSYSKIKTKFKGKVIAIDSSIKKGKYGELLKITNGHYYRLTLTGEKIPLKLQENN